MIHLAPGNPVDYLLGMQPYSIDPESYLQYVTMISEKFGLDKPLHEQLLIYIGQVLTGNLGYSVTTYTYEPVLELIIEKMLNTLLLMGSSLAIACIGGIVLGVLASKKPYSIIDNVVTVISTIGFSIPIAWLGQIAMLVFALYLGWFPVGGAVTLTMGIPTIGELIGLLHHLILPAFTFATIYLAVITRVTRASMLEVLGSDYILTARAKGLPENAILYKHALRNALLPVVSVIGVQLSVMIGGSVVVESVFSWPGLGRLLFMSVTRRDYPVIMGIFVFMGLSVIVVTLIVDLFYAVLDPRIRYK